MANIIQIRRDTIANWTNTNPKLEASEMGLVVDANGNWDGTLKVGNGTDNWTALKLHDIKTGTGGSGSTTVIDNLLSNSATSALSANQGRVLKGLIDAIQTGGNETPATIKTKYESNPNTNAYTDADKSKLASLSNYDDTDIKDSITDNTGRISQKVDKVAGKALSTNDFTTDEKNKLATLENYDDTIIKADVLENNVNINTNKLDIEKKEDANLANRNLGREDENGTTRTIETIGSADNININLKTKGTGKVCSDSWKGTGKRIVSVSADGKTDTEVATELFYLNNTATALTKTNLNTAYPNVEVFTNVLCPEIGKVYIKIDSVNKNWVSSDIQKVV